MQSPEVDGFSLLAAIEQDPATRHTPVLGPDRGGRRRPPPGDAGPLVATAMAGGVVAERDGRRRRLGDPGTAAGRSATCATDDKENP